MAVNEFMDENS